MQEAVKTNWTTPSYLQIAQERTERNILQWRSKTSAHVWEYHLVQLEQRKHDKVLEDPEAGSKVYPYGRS